MVNKRDHHREHRMVVILDDCTVRLIIERGIGILALPYSVMTL